MTSGTVGKRIQPVIRTDIARWRIGKATWTLGTCFTFIAQTWLDHHIGWAI